MIKRKRDTKKDIIDEKFGDNGESFSTTTTTFAFFFLLANCVKKTSRREKINRRE